MFRSALNAIDVLEFDTTAMEERDVVKEEYAGRTEGNDCQSSSLKIVPVSELRVEYEIQTTQDHTRQKQSS